MYSFRTSLTTARGPAHLAFTDRYGGVSAPPYDELNLAVAGDDAADATTENHRRLLADFAPGDGLCDLRQVHGADVAVVTTPPRERPPADAVVSDTPGLTLMVRAADCVPVLLVAPGEGVVGAAHCGRQGLVAGVVPRAVERMRGLGATEVTAWVGPHVCGRCYEVPGELRAEVTAVVAAARAETSWGTPSLDLGAGVRAQLEAVDVQVRDVSSCTRESPDLYSYRRDGAAAGRQAGLVRLAGPGEAA